MNPRILFVLLPLLASLLVSTATAQRVKFQRKKFDRSRFDRAGQTAPAQEDSFAASPEPVVATTAEEEFPELQSDGSVFSSSAPDASDDSTNTSIFSAGATLSPSQPAPYYPKDATPEEKAAIDTPLLDEIPSKVFKNAKKHDELLALQKKTGACMIIYFKNFAVPNEKGLCSWFEKTVTTDMKWRRAMKNFIQLVITVPGTSAVKDLQEHYRANKSPSVFVLKPGSTRATRIKLFEFAPGSRPVPIQAEEVLEAVKTASTPAYQTLF